MPKPALNGRSQEIPNFVVYRMCALLSDLFFNAKEGKDRKGAKKGISYAKRSIA